MSSHLHKAEFLALNRLDENPGGLRAAEWTVGAVEQILAAEGLDVDRDLVVAAAWASATIGAQYWLDEDDGYDLDDVRRDLGDEVARIVEWVLPPDWQCHREHLADLIQHGPQEAQVVALAQAMVRVVQVGNDLTEDQIKAMIKLALAVMPVRALVAAGWRFEVPLAEA